MAVTLLYQYPALFIDEGDKSPPVRKFASNTGHSGTTIINPWDLVVFSSPGINRCVTNSASLSGFTVYGEQGIYGPYGGNPSTTGSPWPWAQTVFGYTSNPGAGVLPDDSIQIAVDSLTGNILLEMSLTNTTGWISGGTQQATINTQVGLFLDPTTNIFVADQTQTNKVAVIRQKAEGPYTLLPSGQYLGKGFPGDLGARVLVSFLPAVLT